MRDYPQELLPKPSYRHRLDFKPIIEDYPNLLVLRMVKGTLTDYTDDNTPTGQITDNILFGSIQNLSMNLLGGLYKFEHVAFLPKEAAAETEWENGFVDFKKFKDSYIKVNPCFHICFKAADIHNTTYPFPVTFKKIEERDEMAKKVKEALGKDKELQIDQDVVGKFVNANEKVNVQVKLKINHSPNMLNYWHVTLDTTRPESEGFIKPNEKLSNRDKRQMKALKQHLIQILVITETVPYKLKRRDYKGCLTSWDKLMDRFGF